MSQRRMNKVATLVGLFLAAIGLFVVTVFVLSAILLQAWGSNK